ncbi:MAG: arginine decarboxylase, partial [Mariprofundaceae bacterium]
RLDEPASDAPMQLRRMWSVWSESDQMAPREVLHDLVLLREDVNRLFSLGHCSLADRAQADAIYWRALSRAGQALDEDEAAEMLPGIRGQLADRYFCNFSLFQSLPDAWAIGQPFPVMPIHRLDEAPTRQGMLVDITCDSDGKMQCFPLGQGCEQTLPLHALNNGDEYLLGVFLVGAYQEILGDLHNLFGDTHAVHVRVDGDQYELEQVVEGESVAEVLDYVEFHEKVLLDRMRRQITRARSAGRITGREATRFLDAFREGLRGYTYLED